MPTRHAHKRILRPAIVRVSVAARGALLAWRGKKLLKQPREYQKQQGITGYKLMLKSEKKYITFKGKPSLATMAFSDEFNEAYVFNKRFELLPYIVEIKGEI